MSTSLLYHAFGIRGYDYVRTEYIGGEVIFTIEQDPDDCRCSAWAPTRSPPVVTSSGISFPAHRGPEEFRRPAIPRVDCQVCGLVGRSRSPLPTPGGATPSPSRDTSWSCSQHDHP